MITKQLQTDWKIKRVSEFAEVITGGTPSTTKKEYWDGGNIPWLPSGDLKDKPIKSAHIFITKEGLKNSAAQIMPKKSVLIALTGATTGQTAILDIEASANQSVTGILPSKEHIPKFLFYYLRTIRNKILNQTYGGAQPHISQGFVKNLVIPLPPLPTQKKIVSILEKAEKLKHNREDADRLTKEYLQSVFYEMFGDPVRNEKKWPKKKLGEISKEIQPGFAFGQFSNTDGLIHLRPFNISDEGFLILDQIKYIPLEEVISEKYFLSKGDVLINTTNSKELVGKTAIFNLNKKYCFSNHMTKIKLDNSITNPNYIWFVLNNYWKSGVFKSIIKSWVNQVGIDSNLLKNQIEIPLPPLPLQQTFASIVEQVEKLKEKQKQSKEEIEELFNSLMQKAFNGELGR